MQRHFLSWCVVYTKGKSGGIMNELFDLPSLEVKNKVSEKKLQPKLAALLKDLNKNLYNKENSIKLILLAVLAGESAFLLGEPGTAKSLIAHRISEGFEDLDTTKPENAGCVKYFEYLMSQFSTPDEIFGPVSLQALKNDEYKRITDNYLPKAQFAFLDEIWKASPAIQNSLLTILNEKKFQNGFESQKVPLQGFVAASNELPAKNEGLEAIFDRFLVRIIEEPISSDSTFFKMITSKKDTNTKIANKIDGSKLKLLQEKAEEVEFPEKLFEIIRNIRQEIKNYNKSLKEDQEAFLVSDRRWKKIVGLLKMSAFLNDRKEINLSDFEIVPYCIWSTENQYEEGKKIVKNVIEKTVKSYSEGLEKLISEMETSRFSAKNIRQKIIDEATLEKQNFDKKINLAEEEAKENIFKQNQFIKIIQKQKSSVEENFEKVIESLKNIRNNQLKIESNHHDIRPLRIEKDSQIVEGINIGNKIISKECYFVNTSLYTVLSECNEMSIEDNLEPVYLMNEKPFSSEDLFRLYSMCLGISVNWNAKGYRIPTFEERFYHIESEENENECVICDNISIISRFETSFMYFKKKENLDLHKALGNNPPAIEEKYLLIQKHIAGNPKDISDKVSCRIVRGKKNVF